VYKKTSGIQLRQMFSILLMSANINFNSIIQLPISDDEFDSAFLFQQNTFPDLS
jgi:hypothetical protein